MEYNHSGTFLYNVFKKSIVPGSQLLLSTEFITLHISSVVINRTLFIAIPPALVKLLFMYVVTLLSINFFIVESSVTVLPFVAYILQPYSGLVQYEFFSVVLALVSSNAIAYSPCTVVQPDASFFMFLSANNVTVSVLLSLASITYHVDPSFNVTLSPIFYALYVIVAFPSSFTISLSVIVFASFDVFNFHPSPCASITVYVYSFLLFFVTFILPV